MYRQLLAGDHLVDNDANVTFLSACQYKYGGIAKEPGETSGELLTSTTLRSTRDPLTHFSDPYHTYLSLASLSLYPPSKAWLEQKAVDLSAWSLHSLDPLLNLRVESAEWARSHIPDRRTIAS